MRFAELSVARLSPGPKSVSPVGSPASESVKAAVRTPVSSGLMALSPLSSESVALASGSAPLEVPLLVPLL